jgi:hypothetical protein
MPRRQIGTCVGALASAIDALSESVEECLVLPAMTAVVARTIGPTIDDDCTEPEMRCAIRTSREEVRSAPASGRRAMRTGR